MDNLERCDTEPLLQSEEFESILKDDSFLPTLGSRPFSELLRSPSNSDNQAFLGKMEIQEPSHQTDATNDPIKTEMPPQWFNLGNDSILSPSIIQKVFKLDDGLLMINPNHEEVVEENESHFINSNEINHHANFDVGKIFQPSLSTCAWPGDYNFKISLDNNKFPSTKWSYSSPSNKLYVMPNVAVPIEVSVDEWFDARINITPVYKKPHFHSETVERCYNHKKRDEESNLETASHIIQLENEDAIYNCIGNRYCVDIPLGTPPPGESSKLLFVKCTCWNTCTGGPNRRQILIVFTLVSRYGKEIGREVLEVKSCQCPIRDIGLEDAKTQVSSKKIKKPKTHKDTVCSKGAKRLKQDITEKSYEQIIVPIEIAPDVKRYVNMLIAEKCVKQNSICKLPFPEYS